MLEPVASKANSGIFIPGNPDSSNSAWTCLLYTSATCFMVGSNVTAGNTPTIQRMAALNCEVANHTNDHKYLTKLGADGIRSQVLSVRCV